MRLASVVLLEGGDADTLVEGEEVTLKNWGNVKIGKIDKDAAGESCRPATFHFMLSFAVRCNGHGVQVCVLHVALRGAYSDCVTCYPCMVPFKGYWLCGVLPSGMWRLFCVAYCCTNNGNTMF